MTAIPSSTQCGDGSAAGQTGGMGRQSAEQCLLEAVHAVARSRHKHYAEDLSEATNELEHAVCRLQELAQRFREHPPERMTPDAQIRLRSQLLELRREVTFAEALHTQAAAFLQGWTQLLSGKLELEVGPAYSAEGRPEPFELPGKLTVQV